MPACVGRAWLSVLAEMPSSLIPPSRVPSSPSQVKASELAGAIKADKQDLRLSELETLFS